MVDAIMIRRNGETYNKSFLKFLWEFFEVRYFGIIFKGILRNPAYNNLKFPVTIKCNM